MRSKAYRRHHAARVRNNFRKVVTHCWGGVGRDPGWIDHATRKWSDTRKPCSCYGCGNQRRYEGAPIRERRHLQK